MEHLVDNRRVVITGIGVLAPGGIGTERFWELLSEGRTATRTMTMFDASDYRSRIAAEVDFDPTAHGLGPREQRRMDRAAQFAVAAAREAVAGSGIELGAMDPSRIGVSVGTAVGATTALEQEYRAASDDGRHWLVDEQYSTRLLYNHFVPSSFAAEVAWSTGAEGPCTVISTGCTSGIDAVAHGCEFIREGSADVVIAGATEAPISPITVACFDAIRATSTFNDDPEHASRPFDSTRNGFVLGEGAAVFVLEELHAARARGAHIYAEVRGYATRSNAYTMTGLRADGAEMAAAIEAALTQARVNPSDIDYVNAHGSGTKRNDIHETAALKRSLGADAHRVPVSSIKSMIGHSLGAIGAIEIAASVLAMENNVIPPTANLRTPDPSLDLDYVPLTARECAVRTVLTEGSGFGGFQSAMVLATPDGAR
ncbi:beta-ketoacyl-[acyl-carrier-protein] synthase family protein [Nocardia jinanensis]|uniref:Actinorhodin polyketide putative beta-ketoacyl synthase 1 n=1 Tax=Nocardia jinanensis TaxID=382504 RepID=A0A917W0G5_9NOCA|nr:beta-ketoacyl-[acyl-carrier-protein] synthase family protein [Nocardia jinanensis]GGL46402.1 actinorhodin polyketide putative beta-ketoacyl synthase 1 [Nocardia jinanensis]